MNLRYQSNQSINWSIHQSVTESINECMAYIEPGLWNTINRKWWKVMTNCSC